MHGWVRAPLFGLLSLCLAALIWAGARAHLTPNSEVTLNFVDDGVTIDAAMPAGDFDLALAAQPDRSQRGVADWVMQQVAATTPDGRRWSIERPTITRVTRDGARYVVAHIIMRPPAGAEARRLTLHWSAIIADNRDHIAMLLVGADHGAGVLPADRKLIGALRQDMMTLTIDRGAFSATAAFGAAFRLGMSHIAEGTDHLMFLLALLLPAPLVASGGRWGAARPLRATAVALLRIITAFTVGHSMTLLLVALAGWQLPVAPVEIAIAVSILLSAVHAIRPLFAGREAWVAMLFGLVHGMAFATLVGDAGIGGTARLLSILGFNIGIEAVQLLVVAAALVPMALVVARPVYRVIRPALALFAAVCALAWIYERTLGGHAPVSDWLLLLTGQPLWLWAGSIAIALVCRLPLSRTRGSRLA